MLVTPLSQHYAATMIIVVFQRRRVKLYEKANSVLYCMEIKCTSLRFFNHYNSIVLTDLARHTA